MINERLEELAALHALGLLSEADERELLDAARRDPEVAALIRDFAETSAALAHAAPQVAPPPGLKAGLMQRLPARAATGMTARPNKVIAFPRWIPYALAAGFMVLGVVQYGQIERLKAEIHGYQFELSTIIPPPPPPAHDALADLRLAALQQNDAAHPGPAYAASRIVVAWDPDKNRGVVSVKGLPPPPPGHDYQLWVLDPKAASPISAGLINASGAFAATSVSTSTPGFAVSLEPSGGRPTPTGPILFVAASTQ